MNTSTATILDSHREKEEHQKHTVREELVVSHKDSHKGTRRSDDRRIRHSDPIHDQTEHSRKNSAEEIHSRKMLGPHHVGNLATEHPEHQHIEQEMPKVHMHEHVGHKTPSLFRRKRPEGAKVSHVFTNATGTHTGQVQLQSEHATDNGQSKNNGIANQQHSQNFR